MDSKDHSDHASFNNTEHPKIIKFTTRTLDKLSHANTVYVLTAPTKFVVKCNITSH